MKCSDADHSAADLAIKETTGQDFEKDVTIDTIIHEPDSDDSFIEETSMILHNWLLLTQQICLIMLVI